MEHHAAPEHLQRLFERAGKTDGSTRPNIGNIDLKFLEDSCQIIVNNNKTRTVFWRVVDEKVVGCEDYSDQIDERLQTIIGEEERDSDGPSKVDIPTENVVIKNASRSEMIEKTIEDIYIMKEMFVFKILRLLDDDRLFQFDEITDFFKSLNQKHIERVELNGWSPKQLKKLFKCFERISCLKLNMCFNNYVSVREFDRSVSAYKNNDSDDEKGDDDDVIVEDETDEDDDRFDGILFGSDGAVSQVDDIQLTGSGFLELKQLENLNFVRGIFYMNMTTSCIRTFLQNWKEGKSHRRMKACKFVFEGARPPVLEDLEEDGRIINTEGMAAELSIKIRMAKIEMHIVVVPNNI
ncbi:hypothetical protein L3Y34_011957 [Caenorhabditis briggsae]|uniref:F-box associated domain-containing protein n=1 Tax=Caenorhabditis briggsae TaxID=6238 RepID=A0AAE9CUK4_CAEBR|nr:hypothetical protein L3Y34_011957 [Caenorhabditis briggsae]